MISTRGICSTGEKKCRPMNCLATRHAGARSFIGMAEVFEAQWAFGPSTASTSRVTLCLISMSLDDRLDDQVAAREIRVSSVGTDARLDERPSRPPRCFARLAICSSQCATALVEGLLAAMSFSTTSKPRFAQTKASPRPSCRRRGSPTWCG
jgi:hypothetical protein